MTKNLAKYNSYRYSFSRMDEAIKAGFFLEAVIIAESLISDRLLSVLLKNQILSEIDLKKNLGFATLIERQKSLPNPFGDTAGLHEWRKKRNEVVHAIAKSLPGQPTKDTREFKRLAKNTAKVGRLLCDNVKSWSRRKQNRVEREKFL